MAERPNSLAEFQATRRLVEDLAAITHDEDDRDRRAYVYAGDWHIELSPNVYGSGVTWYGMLLDGEQHTTHDLESLESLLWDAEQSVRASGHEAGRRPSATPEYEAVLRDRALVVLDETLELATELGLLDRLAEHAHPDAINQFCDAVKRMREARDAA